MTRKESVVKFGELNVGDWILGPNNQPVQVVRAYEPHMPERMYELEFEDGTKINASGNHLWYVEPDADRLAHSSRLQQAKRLLKEKDWREEALFVAESVVAYEIGQEDLNNFFDFIEDESERYFFIARLLASVGPMAEETRTYRDTLTGEEVEEPTEVVYDARRVFQQALSLTGERKYRRRWAPIVGRVVTTDMLFSHYPDVDVPVPHS